jgi:hypothetical protein
MEAKFDQASTETKSRSIGCCFGAKEGAQPTPESPLNKHQRRARMLIGLGTGAIGALLCILAIRFSSLGLFCQVPLWLSANATGWFGVSHLVASITGYQGCPELGAIPSLILRRRVVTSCQGWDQLDNRLSRQTSQT